MKTKLLLHQLLAALLVVGTAGAADKVKRADVSDYPFYSAKKRGYVAQFVPGLTAVLQLSETQRQRIAAAREEMLSDDAVKAARGISKSDPSVTAERREKARATLDSATAGLREKVATILTPEQKALIDKINSAHAVAAEETGIAYEDKFGSVKDDEAARRRLHEEMSEDLLELFRRKLDAVLTASQKEVMARAADEENRRLAETAAYKKPKK